MPPMSNRVKEIDRLLSDLQIVTYSFNSIPNLLELVITINSRILSEFLELAMLFLDVFF